MAQIAEMEARVEDDGLQKLVRSRRPGAPDAYRSTTESELAYLEQLMQQKPALRDRVHFYNEY